MSETGESLYSKECADEFNRVTIESIAEEWSTGNYRGLIFLDFDGVFFDNVQEVDPEKHPLIVASREGKFPYTESAVRHIVRMETYSFLPPERNTHIYRMPANELVLPEVRELMEAQFLVVGLTAQTLVESQKSQLAIEGYLNVPTFHTISAYYMTKGESIARVLALTGEVPQVYAIDDNDRYIEEIRKWGHSRVIKASSRPCEGCYWWGEIAKLIKEDVGQ
jgi:hypothetical protein